jgi:heavy metal sensor kinase
VKTTFGLRTRLTVFYTLVFGVLLMALAAVSYRFLAYQLDADASATVTEMTDGLHGYLRFDEGKPSIVYDNSDPNESEFVQRATRFYQIYDTTTGALLTQSDALEPLGVLFTPQEVRSLRDRSFHDVQFHDIQTDYGRIRLANSVITGENPANVYLLQVGVSLAVSDAALQRFLQLLLWGMPAGLIIAVIAGRAMAGVALAPLARLAAAARTIDASNLQQRLPVRGTGDELDNVAQSFNDTLARVEDAVGEMRQFSTAIAHELRTPIAALRGEIELAARRAGATDEQREIFASQLEELDKLKRLIDQLLTLARAESGQIRLAHERVALAPLVGSIVEQLEPVAQAQGLTLIAAITARPAISGDASWIERLLLNLLDNAFKFTPPGGRVTVHLGEDEGDAVLEVSDTGIGMTPDVVPHVFERFYRGDPARSAGGFGVGVGLSLVKWIVDQHSGTVAAEGTAGVGARFTVKLKSL